MVEPVPDVGDLSLVLLLPSGSCVAERVEPDRTFVGGTVEVGVPREAIAGLVGVLALIGEFNELGNGKVGAEFKVGVKAANNGRINEVAFGDCKVGVLTNWFCCWICRRASKNCA